MGIPEDLFKRMKLGRPGTILPSDLELLLKEVQYLKAEIKKIKEALKRHGIEVD